MAAEIVIRKLLDEHVPGPGARPGTSAVSLKDYAAVFRSRQIYMGTRHNACSSRPIFREILGEVFDEWPIRERFGLISVSIAFVWEGDKLWYVPRRWHVGPLPMSKFLMPTGASFESGRNGDFRFDVTIRSPVIGRIVTYKGTLRRVNGKS